MAWHHEHRARADDHLNATIPVDLAPLHLHFLARLPASAHILDAG